MRRPSVFSRLRPGAEAILTDSKCFLLQLYLLLTGDCFLILHGLCKIRVEIIGKKAQLYGSV